MMNMAITSADGQNKKKKKKTQGRRKIEIKEIEKKSSLHVTFSKRRHGLMKKASEISILCGAEAALIALSPGEKKVFAFGHPDVESVLARHTNYQSLSAYNNNNHTLKSSKQLAAAPTVGSSQELGIQQQELKLRREYEESLQKLQEEKMKAAAIANEEELIKQKGNIGNGFWWEDPVDDMGLQELEDFKKALLQLRRNAASKFNHCYGDASYPLNSLVSGGTDIIGCSHLMHGPPQIN